MTAPALPRTQPPLLDLLDLVVQTAETVRAIDLPAIAAAAVRTASSASRCPAEDADRDGSPECPGDDPGAALCDLIRIAERTKNALCGLQATLTNALVPLREAQAAAEGEAGTGFERAQSNVQRSRHVPPSRAGELVHAAVALNATLPRTLDALSCGEATEAQACSVVSKSSVLAEEHHAALDAEIGPRLQDLALRSTRRALDQISATLDPRAAAAREEAARKNRYVSLAQEDDGMARLVAVLPAAQAQAAHRVLSGIAATAIAEADGRTRGQLMADTLVSCLLGAGCSPAPGDDDPTGPAEAGRPVGQVPPTRVEVQVVITDHALLGLSETPGRVDGTSIIPAHVARMLAAGTAGPTSKNAPPEISEDVDVRIRKLYAHPDTGVLVAMESTSRTFPEGMRRFVLARDAWCRTPGCDAEIAHIDHVRPVRSGGPTTIANAQGLCVACNLRKEKGHWTATANPDGSITTVLPGGEAATSWPEPLPMDRMKPLRRAA